MFNPADARTLIVYGGTFDPPHRAHVELPSLVAEQIGADGVLYIPAGQPPHKVNRSQAPAEHRLAMLELALGDRPRTVVSTWEIEQPAPSYTYRTLEHLRDAFGDGVALRLLIGMDMALMFDQWVEPERIERLAEPVVMVRPPHDRDSFCQAMTPGQRERWSSRVVEVPTVDVSSTQLRRALQSGEPDQPIIQQTLDPRVRDYILRHGLYGPDNPT